MTQDVSKESVNEAVVADLDTMTATKETLEDYTLRFAPAATAGGRRRTDDGIDVPMYDEHGNPSGETLKCHVCQHDYERPDMMKCATHDAHVCSLCLSTDKVGRPRVARTALTAGELRRGLRK
jgi:hypothetical protein